MILDNVAFHTAEDYPADLPAASAATHMGYYWSWAVRRGLHNPQWDTAAAAAMNALKTGALSGAQFVLDNMAGSLEDTDFNDEGRRFALFYYEDEDEGYGQFMTDYIVTLNTPALASFYHVAISRDNQALLDAVFDTAWHQWRRSLRPQSRS